MTRRSNLEEGDDRIEERRRRILHAAAAVFSRRGYHCARTREIAEEAGVAEGTIYNYYSNKRELLLTLIQHIVTDSVPRALDEAHPQDLRSLLTAFLRDRLEMLDRNRAFIKAVVPEMINDPDLRSEYLQQVVIPVVEQLMPLARGALASGQMRPLNPRVMLPAVVGAAVSAFVFNEVLDVPMGVAEAPRELAADLAELLLTGLQAPGGPDTTRE